MGTCALLLGIFGLSGCVTGPPAAATPAAEDSVPVIDSVTFHEETLRYLTVFPEFHFHDASGSVRFIHREVVETDAPKPLHVRDGVINISAAQQKKGATFVGGWGRGPEVYHVRLRAWIINDAGRKSNVVEYTIHCNDG
jgi:hypothetical protein